MTTEPQRPDPDALLATLTSREKRKGQGRLKIFFGMCPGVGKTFSMLRAAHQETATGKTVLVGLVETHKRVETEALLTGLTILPRKQIEYRGTTITEFNLEAALAQKPDLILVDELAHSNAPTSRHAKRWQDIAELLDAGISVFSTLNVQHVESRADAVQQITGAPIHETVPDSIIDIADQLELIDVTPETLLERLRDGKVYMGERVEAAQQNFFKEAHIAALRELALRYTAERVDTQLRVLRATSGRRTVWRSGERLLVAVGPSPFSTELIRWTRRMSANQGASWVAVHVESRNLSPAAQQGLDKNLALARELGAEVVVTHDTDISEALVRVALQHNATQIVIGKSRQSPFRRLISGGSLVDRLLRGGGNIDIYVVPGESRKKWQPDFEAEHLLQSPRKEYTLAATVVAVITVAGFFLPQNYYLSVGLVYLLGVIMLSLRVGQGPVLAAGVTSALLWDYLFIPPKFTFYIGKIEDALLFGTYFVVALVSGQMTSRIRAQARNERLREERATALFHLTRAMSEARSMDDAVFAALRQVDTLFQAKTCLLIAQEPNGPIEPHFAGSVTVSDKERGVIDWTFLNKKRAGRFTETLPGSEGYYLPLVRDDDAVGILGVFVGPEGNLGLSQRDLLEVFARQLAFVVEREILRTASEREKVLKESEKFNRTLLDSVSHELRTPLAVIQSAVENYRAADAALRDDLVDEMGMASRRLNRLVGNLLDQTRLESGALKPRVDWCDASDVVNAATEASADAMDGHPLECSVEDNLPPIRADFALLEQALANLLVNAANHTPVGTPIFLSSGLERSGERVYFTVADRGPGLPEAMRERLFKKFVRGDAARAGGLGLGLSIVRGFVEAQGGEIVAGANPGGGAVFTIYLPHQNPDNDGA